MPGIKQPIQDLLTKISTLDVTNDDGNSVKLYTRIWNNQISYEEDGQLYNFPKPASFIEPVSPVTYEIIGQGYRSADISFRVHLAVSCYNEEGTFEQDLKIFALKDKIVSLLTGYKPTNCGPLNCISEQQDFTHRNVYHYILDFVTNFTDTTGSKYDANHPDAYKQSTPPTTLVLNVTTEPPYLKPQ